MSDTNRMDLPPPGASNFTQRVRETLQTYLGKQGNTLDRGLTLRDLIESGFAVLPNGWKPGGAGALPLQPGAAVQQGVVPDLTPPPMPLGFALSAAISHVFVEHDDPIYQQGHGHLRTHVYGAKVASGAALPTFSDAVELGQFSGRVWGMPSDPATTWRLWIKWETNDGVLSSEPAGGTNGMEAITGQNVNSMVKAMTGVGKPFTVLSAPQVIDGVTYPAGIYSTNAFIMDAQITRAKIANLAVDDAKVANLNASKINAGYISADRIQAGSLDTKLLNVDAAAITYGYINVARISDAAITSAKIASLDANKINAASLSAINANLGLVTAGRMESKDAYGNPDGKFVIDLTNRYIRIEV